MLAEIKRLKLPMGVWQGQMKKALPIKDVTITINYPDNRTAFFKITQDKKNVGHFALSFLQGCKGILVSHTMLVEPAYRGKGIAKELQKSKQRIAKDLKVAMILATVVATNDVQEKVIKDWGKVGSFKNERTGNKVNVFLVDVNKKK